MQLDLSNDWKVWEKIEQVNFTSIQTANGSNSWENVPAKRRAPTWKERQASNGVYTASDLVFFVPTNQLTSLANNSPKPADQITDSAGEVWTVLEVQWRALKSNYWLMCRNMVLAYQLEDTISIERATLMTDSAGAYVKSFPTSNPSGGTVVYSGPARVQPERAEILDERAIRGTVNRFDIWLPQDVLVTNEDRILITGNATNWKGSYLEIRGYRDRERITDLPSIQAELLP